MYDFLFDELPAGTTKHIVRSIEFVKKLRAAESKADLLSAFFRNALLPYYDCMWEGTDAESGCIIYHLAAQIKQEIRKTIEVYPRISENTWVTLEEWMGEWEEFYPDGVPAPKTDVSKLLTEKID